MILELLLAVQLLETNERSTPQAVAPNIFGRNKTKSDFTPITLGKPKTIGEVMADLPPQRIEDITIPERYFRRPKGLN